MRGIMTISPTYSCRTESTVHRGVGCPRDKLGVAKLGSEDKPSSSRIQAHNHMRSSHWWGRNSTGRPGSQNGAWRIVWRASDEWYSYREGVGEVEATSSQPSSSFLGWTHLLEPSLTLCVPVCPKYSSHPTTVSCPEWGLPVQVLRWGQKSWLDSGHYGARIWGTEEDRAIIRNCK